ncbi:MAG: DUF4278 domain-containing protein [Chlorogloeopsis fritschii C42_A2020_084]|jgi:predicted membrane protein|uniref:DUF4278 domain-containing protein n=1 Tax=Chlorogloeopsis fritschii TaxID=1124 RepID=UPI0019EFA259|nr:DUF4278 domain-containing protein [Chlorogloeopsis fritschii]MBF2006867.1 DUF4278 domain-containing protein [Chlorogloeopsis fritschii C42_A2020_084]
MPLLFLIPLFTGLVTGYIYKTSTDEIGQLTGVVAAISLILSLVLAPWQIQVLMLVVVLVGTQKLLQQNEYKLRLDQNNQQPMNDSGSNEAMSSQSSTKANEINRKYRGGNYQINNVRLEFSEREISGKYRGLPLKIHQIAKIQ